MSFLARNIRITFLVFLANILCCQLFSQEATVFIDAEEQVLFQLAINEKKQTETYVSKVQLIGLNKQQNYKLTFNFKDDTLQHTTSIYIMDDGVSQHYLLKNNKLELLKVLFSPHQQQVDSAVFTVQLTEKLVATIPEIKDTLVIEEDTLTQKVPFDDYYRMPDYEGEIGCPWPLKDEELNEVKLKVNNLSIDDRKIDVYSDFRQSTLDFCITIEQLRSIVILFEYDEFKIEIVKNSYPFIYDKDNILLLEKDFSYQNSFDELKKQLGI
ncbi:MAG: DUF4476 domain-containing protein [Vicingaceae bacterium]|nr:DUF4476 domain-containing protein [Vicingaceae bacterium]